MKIDNFDNTMICEMMNLNQCFHFSRKIAKIPEYIELSILKIVRKMGLQDCYTIKEYLNNLPKILWII